MEFKIPWDQFRITRDLMFEIQTYFLSYLRNPVEAVKNLPRWGWPVVLVLLGAYSAICGTLSGILSVSILNIFAGLIFAPLFSVGIALLTAYLFQHFAKQTFHRELSFDGLFTLFAFCSVPHLTFFILSPILSIFTIVGLFLSFYLVYVGLIHNFALPKKKVLNWLALIYAVFVLMWIGSTIRESQFRSRLKQTATPESLDILENELKNN